MPGKPGDEKREWEPGKRRLEDTWKKEEMNVVQEMTKKRVKNGQYIRIYKSFFRDDKHMKPTGLLWEGKQNG